MKGSLYLIGGGDIRKGETAQIDDELKQIAPKSSTFAFFGTAAGDNPDYINSVRSVFEDHFTFVALMEKDGPELARSVIDSASVIYLGGGTTELLLNLFEKWGLVGDLRKALDRGAILVGMSAGAQALCDWYIHENGDSMELLRGWGFVSGCVLVHAHQNSFARAKLLWEKNEDARTNVFLGIEEGAAWRANAAGAEKVGAAQVWQASS